MLIIVTAFDFFIGIKLLLNVFHLVFQCLSTTYTDSFASATIEISTI